MSVRHAVLGLIVIFAVLVGATLVRGHYGQREMTDYGVPPEQVIFLKDDVSAVGDFAAKDEEWNDWQDFKSAFLLDQTCQGLMLVSVKKMKEETHEGKIKTFPNPWWSLDVYPDKRSNELQNDRVVWSIGLSSGLSLKDSALGSDSIKDAVHNVCFAVKHKGGRTY